MLTTDAHELPIAEAPTETDRCARLRRWFIVELVLILYIFGIFPVQTLSQKYILKWMTNDSLHILASKNISYYQTNTTFDPCNSNESDPIYQFQEYVQSRSSQFVLYESIISGVPAFFVTIILGAGSDHFGRRFAILPPLIGSLLGGSIVTCVISTKSSIYWLFLSDAVNGCCGSFLTLLMGCLAYVADRTPPERRMTRITFLEMSLFIPGVVCPIVFGKVTTEFGYLATLLFVLSTSALNIVYVFIFLPNDSKRMKGPSATVGSITTCPSSTTQSQFHSTLSLLWIQVRSMVALFTEKWASTAASLHWRRLKLNLLIAAFFITNLPTFDLSVSNFFMMNTPLCWGIDTIGLFYGVSTAVSCVGAMIITPLFKRCGMQDYLIAILAGLACTATNVYKAFVKTTVMMFLTLSLSMIGILIIPSLRSLMSNQVKDDQQGAIFGAIACVEIICGIIGTIIFNSAYSTTLHISTGFVFFIMAAFYAAGCALVCIYGVLTRLDAQRGSSLSVPITEPLLEDAESDDLQNEQNIWSSSIN